MQVSVEDLWVPFWTVRSPGGLGEERGVAGTMQGLLGPRAATISYAIQKSEYCTRGVSPPSPLSAMTLLNGASTGGLAWAESFRHTVCHGAQARHGPTPNLHSLVSDCGCYPWARGRAYLHLRAWELRFEVQIQPAAFWLQSLLLDCPLATWVSRSPWGL